MAELHLPNLVIAGVAKAGTTSLFSYLAQHPEICGSDVKETRYFEPLRLGGELEPIERYAAHFRQWRGERYTLEATPGYFNGGRRVAAAMRALLPEVRVVVILRDPADRCWSYFRFAKSRGDIPDGMDFEGYIERCAQLHERGEDELRENRVYLGLSGGCYAQWLPDWSDELQDRLKIVYFDDLSDDAPTVVKQLCGWLDIDADAVDRFQLSVENKTEQVRSNVAQQAALALNRRAEPFFRRHPAVKRRLRRLYYGINREGAQLTVSPAAAKRMADFYEPWDELLVSQLEALGEPLPLWSTVPH
jgi:hypothetical protein